MIYIGFLTLFSKQMNFLFCNTDILLYKSDDIAVAGEYSLPQTTFVATAYVLLR